VSDSIDPISRRREGLRRRDFLALGGATAAVAALPRVALADESPLGVNLTKASPLSVGYVVGSDDWEDTLDLPWEGAGGGGGREFPIEVVPARSLTVSSEYAGRLVEFAVHGLVPGVPRPNGAAWRTAYLFFGVSAPPDLVFGPDPVPFLAWSARVDSDPRQAAKVRPILETGVDGSLHVAIETRTPPRKPGNGGIASLRPGFAPDPPPVALRSADFTVDATPHRPKLQQGVYLLAVAAGIWDEPWSGDVFELGSVPGYESIAIGVRAID
jgi:hypothetical protein